jgi:hypothetical protein
VSNHLQFFNGFLQWSINFVRVTHGGELEFFSSFFIQLYSIKLEQDGANNICWNPSKKGLLDVKSFYNVLIPPNSKPFP